MSQFYPLPFLVLTTICLSTALQASAQQLPSPSVLPQTLTPIAVERQATLGAMIRGKLPDDLPQSKLLFIKYQPITLPPEGPTGWGHLRNVYFVQKNHNKVIGEANQQLRDAAAHYPYSYRITVPDSVAYYRDQQGYRYMLMQSSFNAAADGTFRGTTNTSSGVHHTKVDLYVQDLTSADRFVFDDFSETFIYYYKGQVEMLLKKINKQFNAKK